MSIAPPAKRRSAECDNPYNATDSCHTRPQSTACHTLAMDGNNIVPPRRSGRPAVPPAWLRHAGQPGAAAGFGVAASGETSPDLPSDAASSSSSPASRPFDFDSGIKDMRNYLEKEAVGRQTAPAPEISTPTPSSEILDVSGSGATVQSTSGRHKHSRARRPSSVGRPREQAVTRTARPLGMMLALRVKRKTQESYLTDKEKRVVKEKGASMRTRMRAPSRGKGGRLRRL